MVEGVQMIGAPLPQKKESGAFCRNGPEGASHKRVPTPFSLTPFSPAGDSGSSFLDYELPAHLIAQEPCAERDQARLLVLGRNDSRPTNHVFADLPELLVPSDLLVLNDTKVVPARLIGRRARTGGKWVVLVSRELE